MSRLGPLRGRFHEAMTTYRVALNGLPDIIVDCAEFMIGSDGKVTFYEDDDTVAAYVPAASLSHIVRESK